MTRSGGVSDMGAWSLASGMEVASLDGNPGSRSVHGRQKNQGTRGLEKMDAFPGLSREETVGDPTKLSVTVCDYPGIR